MHRHGADDMRAARSGERCGRQGWQGPFDRIAEADGGGELTLDDHTTAEKALQVVAPANPRRWWRCLVRLNFRPRSRLHAGWQFGSAIAGADNTRAEYFEHAEGDATGGRGEPVARLGLIGPGRPQRDNGERPTHALDMPSAIAVSSVSLVCPAANWRWMRDMIGDKILEPERNRIGRRPFGFEPISHRAMSDRDLPRQLVRGPSDRTQKPREAGGRERKAGGRRRHSPHPLLGRS